jgi:hypothetical protein
MKVLLERGSFRFVERGTIELNGMPDFRLQEKNYYTQKWFDVYLFDNQIQCLLAMEDAEYPKWLTGKPCYIRDSVCR